MTKLRKFKSGASIENLKLFDIPTKKEISLITQSMKDKNYGKALSYSGLSLFRGDLENLIKNNPKIQDLIGQLNSVLKKSLNWK